MRKLILLLLLLLALVPFSLSGDSPSSITPSDYDYRTDLVVTNNTGTVLTNRLLPVETIDATFFLQADRDDFLILPPGSSTPSESSYSPNFSWFRAASVPAGISTYYLYTGNAVVTHDYGFQFDSSGDYITVADHAELDFTNSYSLSTRANLLTIPAVDTFLVYKRASYSLGVRSGNEVFGQVHLGNVSLEDSSPNTNTFTTLGSPAFVQVGALYESTDMDSANDLYTAAADASMDNIFTGGGTAEFYVNLDTVTNSDYIIEKNAWFATVNTIACGAGTAKIEFRHNFDFSNGTWTSTACVLTTAAGWQRVSIVYNKDNVANDPILYLNGVSQAVTETVIPNAVAISEAGIPFYIGHQAVTSDGVDGQVDDVRLWDDTRTPAEVLANWNIELAGTEAGLVAYWRLDSAGTEVNFSPIVVNTYYTFAVTYDGNDLILLVNGNPEDTVAIVDTILVTANNVLLGPGFDGILTTFSLGTIAQTFLAFDFEPLNVLNTQEGTANNSWVWTYSVEDTSAGVDQDGIATLSRNMADIFTKTSTTIIMDPPSTTVVPLDIPAGLGNIPVNTNLTGSNVSSSFPFKFLETDMARAGVSLAAFWFAIVAVFAYVIAVMTVRFTKMSWLGVLIFAGLMMAATASSFFPLLAGGLLVLFSVGLLVLNRGMASGDL